MLPTGNVDDGCFCLFTSAPHTHTHTHTHTRARPSQAPPTYAPPLASSKASPLLSCGDKTTSCFAPGPWAAALSQGYICTARENPAQAT